MLETEQKIRNYTRNNVTEKNSGLHSSIETEKEDEIDSWKQEQRDYNVLQHIQRIIDKPNNLTIILIKLYFVMYIKKAL